MTGYGALASMMASHQSAEAFRKFSSMNLENILHMQAELQHLELIINEIRKIPELNSFDRTWIESPCLTSIVSRASPATDRGARSDAHKDRTLLQTAKINAMHAPQKDDLDLRRKWYDEESGGNHFLYGVEAGIFRDETIETDFMTLKENLESQDALARFLGRRIVPLYHRTVGHRIHRTMEEKAFEQTCYYTPETLVRIGNTICMLLSAIIPALSIMVLFSVQSIGGRLIAISMMSLIFSLVMNVIAQRRADVFMSTTAFAAVLVVFVGSANVMNG